VTPTNVRYLDAPQLLDLFDPFSSYPSGTMGGGAWVLAHEDRQVGGTPTELADYVVVKTDVIVQYERAIHELRREILHYMRLLSSLRKQDLGERYLDGISPSHMDAASVRVLDSIVQARIPASATFLDFQDGEY